MGDFLKPTEVTALSIIQANLLQRDEMVD